MVNGSNNKKESLVLALCMCIVYQPILLAAPLPTSPNIQHGDININTAGQQMGVNQSSQYGIVDWDSFSIDVGYGVNFNNGSGSTLNRVTGVDVSNIYGSLSATGNLYLLNSNGIIIGEGGQVLTGGNFVGSTHNISNADFLNGNGFSLLGTGQGSVTNLGKISSSGGHVLLAGYTVENKGEVSAEQGNIALLAGTKIDVLTDTSWLGGAFAVSLGERGNDITNEGRIEAMVAELRTHNGNIYALAGNNDGLIQATGVRNEGGKVILTAENGNVQSSGTIIAQRDGNGGDIDINASSVENYGGVQDVSGAQGGRIAITTEQFISDTTMLAQGASGNGGVITVDASKEVLITSGGNISADGAANGGEVVINAGDGRLILSGNIFTRGTLQGGRTSLWGDSISMLGGSVIADGGPLGGEIYMGGGYQGASIWNDGEALLDVTNSQSTYISETSLLSADAGLMGKGGTVVAWSDGTTQFAGQINARGGVQGGDGGLVETSGLEGLGVEGLVDAGARASYGLDGSWLLDPKNIVIDSVTDAFSQFQRVVGQAGGEPADLVANAGFGGVLDISGDTVVVGHSNSLVLSAYVYKAGAIAARLTSNVSSGGSSFGTGVAVLDDGVSGAIVAVLDRDVINQPDGPFSRRTSNGAADIFFEGDGWQNGNGNQTAKLFNPFAFDFRNPSQSSFGSQFGVNGSSERNISLTRSIGGTIYVAVADQGFDNSTGLDVGAVNHASISNTGQSFGFTQMLAATPTAGARFGSNFALGGGRLYAGDNRGELLVDTFQGVGLYNFAGEGVFSNWVADGDRLYFGGGSNRFSFIDFELVGFEAGVSNGTLTQQSNRQDIAIDTSAIGGTYSSIAVSGDTVLVGNRNHTVVVPSVENFARAGGAAFYIEPTAGWTTGTPFSPVSIYTGGLEAEAFFGDAVAVDGNTAIVGAPRADINVGGAVNDIGEVVQYGRTGSNWGQIDVTYTPGQRDPSNSFGNGVAIDGNTFIVSNADFGAIDGGSSRGAVFVYEDDALSAVLSSSSNTDALFGVRLDFSDDTVAVLSRLNSGTSQSRVSVYERGNGWRNGQNNIVANTTSSTNSIFSGVAIDGDSLVVNVDQHGGINFLQVYENAIDNWNASLATPVLTTAPLFSTESVLDQGAIDISGNTIVALYNNDRNIGTPGIRTPVVLENIANDWSTAVRTNLVNPLSGGINFINQTSVGVSGDTIVLSGDGNGAAAEAAFVFERTSDWASAANHIARLSSTNATISDFSTLVAIDGDLIAVSANQSGNGQISFFERQSGWQDGIANLVSEFNSSGPPVQINSLALSGNRVVAGNQQNALEAIRIDGPFDISGLNTFGSNAALTRNISPDSLTRSLALGTDITLQANNDITIRSAIIANNPLGDGGDLSLQAGRNILVNDDINTDNGNLTLVANDARATQSERDAGEGVVVLGRDAANQGVTLTTGTGNVVISGERFENRTGSNTPFVFDATNPGRYVVYSERPDRTGAPDIANLGRNADISGSDFTVFNASFSATDPLPAVLPVGSGFVYAVQPTLNVNVADATITYGGVVSSTATLASISVNGIDVAASEVASFGVLASDINAIGVDVASSVTSSASGFSNAGSYNAALTATGTNVTIGALHSVNIATGTAGNLVVNQANLRATANDATRVYGDENPDFTVTYSGFIGGEDEAVLTSQAQVSSTVNASSDVQATPYTLVAAGAISDNYAISHVNGNLTITQRVLQILGLSGVDRNYDATISASFQGTASIDNALAGDDISLGGSLSANASFDDKNVGTDKVISVTGFVLNGSDAGNYSLNQPTGLTADVTAATLLVSGLDALNRVYDATTDVVVNGVGAVAAFGSDVVNVVGTAIGRFDDKNVGDDKAVNIVGLSLSGADATNYELNTNLTANVTQVDLNVSGLSASNRVYDATTVASLNGTAAVSTLDSDTVVLSGTAVANFDDKNAATGKDVSVTGFEISGTDAANYNLIQPTGLSADVTALAVNVSGVSGVDRRYDATTVAILNGTAVVAALASDNVQVTGTAVANFDDKNVGTDKSINVTGFVLTGADAGNYSVVQPQNVVANIIQRALVLSGVVIGDKVYDATTVANVSGTEIFSGVLSGDTVTINAGAIEYAFDDKNAGADKLVAVSGVVLSGADAANYSSSDFGLTASIAQASLTVSDAVTTDRAYDSTVNVAVTGGNLQGVIAGDTITFDSTTITGVIGDKNVGAGRAVTTSGYAISGLDAANYVVEQPSLTVTITQALLNLVGLNGDKTYDGVADTLLSFTGLDALFGNDDVNVDSAAVTASYDDKNAGQARNININGNFAVNGSDAANYSLVQPSNVIGDVAQLGITVDGITIADRVYDGTVDAQISGTGSFGGAIAGDDLAINVGAIDIEFSDKNVGDDKAVSLSGIVLSGTDANNYTAATPVGLTGNVTALNINASGLSADDKVYDRTATAALLGTGVLQGTIAGDSISLDETNRTGVFDDKNVGDAKGVTVQGLALAGADAGNYNLVEVAGITATISRADVNLTGVVAADRVYDTTTEATLRAAGSLDFGTLTNVLASEEDVNLAGSLAASFDDKNVGTGKSVTLSGVTLAGVDANNYNLVRPSDISADVTAATLLVSDVGAASRVYDATDVATLTTFGTIQALGADEVNLATNAVTALFDDKNAGDDKVVNVAGYQLGGTDAANYTVVQPTGITASISQAELALLNLRANDREYDGSTVVPLSGNLDVVVLGSDDVSVAGQLSANYDDKNVGVDKAVNVTGIALAGSDANNYTLIEPSLFATVTQRVLNIFGISADDKTYDGIDAAALTGDSITLNNVVTGDDVDFNLQAIDGTFANRNAGIDKAVTLSGNGLSGADAANYTQQFTTNITASITPRALVIDNVTAINRQYDGTANIALIGGELVGVVTGDSIILDTANTQGTVTNVNVSDNLAVTAAGFALTGNDVNNYSVEQPQGLFASIIPRVLNILGVEIADKFFDGNTDAVASGGTLANTIAGEDVSLIANDLNATFDNTDVGNDKNVSVTGFVLAGSAAANYVIDSVLDVLGNILAEIIITEIIPAEVLRATADANLEQQREAFVALANTEKDALVVEENYEAFIDEAYAISASVSFSAPNDAIITLPVEQQTRIEQDYIAAFNANNQLVSNIKSGYSQYYNGTKKVKGLEQQYNQAVRDIAVENNLTDSYQQEIDRVEQELFIVDQRLADINESKRRLAVFTERKALSARLGRGAEADEYQKVIDDAKAVIALESETLAEKSRIGGLKVESEQRLVASKEKTAKLSGSLSGIKEDLASSETVLKRTKADLARDKQQQQAAEAKLARAVKAGKDQIASRLKNADEYIAKKEKESADLQNLANSDLPQKVAAKQVVDDPIVKSSAARAKKSKELSSSLHGELITLGGAGGSPSVYVAELVAQISRGEGLDTPAEMRTNLIKRVPALRQTQAEYEVLQQEANTEFNSTGINMAVEMNGPFGLKDVFDEFGVDLTNVPSKDASGRELPFIERLSIFMVNKTLNDSVDQQMATFKQSLIDDAAATQTINEVNRSDNNDDGVVLSDEYIKKTNPIPFSLGSPEVQALIDERNRIAIDYKNRMGGAIASEIGFSPDQALDDPNILVKEVGTRLPFKNGAIDRETIAQNLKDGASIYVNMRGIVKDQAMALAADEDPTGTLHAVNSVEEAARAEFAEQYGAQPEELFLNQVGDRIDLYKNVSSPQELANAYMEDTGIKQGIEEATIMFNGLKNGDSPVDIFKSIQTSRESDDPLGSTEQKAQAAKAVTNAAISAAEEADPTGLFKASNNVKGDMEEAFADAFGVTSEELALEAITDPAAAVGRASDLAKEIASSPMNMMGKGMNIAADIGMAGFKSVASELKNPDKFIANAGKAIGDTVVNIGKKACVWCKEGKSDADKQAEAAAIAKARYETVGKMMALAQKMASNRMKMANDMSTMKAKVGQVVAAELKAKNDKVVAEVHTEIAKEQYTASVKAELTNKANLAKAEALESDPAQLKAQAARWGV